MSASPHIFCSWCTGCLSRGHCLLPGGGLDVSMALWPPWCTGSKGAAKFRSHFIPSKGINILGIESGWAAGIGRPWYLMRAWIAACGELKVERPLFFVLPIANSISEKPKVVLTLCFYSVIRQCRSCLLSIVTHSNVWWFWRKPALLRPYFSRVENLIFFFKHYNQLIS